MGQALSILSGDIATIIARRLPRNEVRCVLRLVNRETRDVVDALFDDVVVHLFEEGLPARELRWFLLDAAASESVVARMDFAQRVRLMRTAASTGDADTLRLAQSRCGILPPPFYVTLRQLMRAEHHTYLNDIHPVLRAALRSCTTPAQALEMVGPLLGPLAQLPKTHCEVVRACVDSSYDVRMAFVEDLKRFDSDEDYRTMCVCAVAYSCDLATLQGVLERPGARWDDARVLREAVMSPTADWQDKLRAVEAAQQPDDVSPYLLTDAWSFAAGGPCAVEHLQWLQDQGRRLNPMTVMHTAIMRNPSESADILRYVIQKQLSLSPLEEAILSVAAARCGDLAVLEAFNKHNDANVVRYAVQAGHVHILRASDALNDTLKDWSVFKETLPSGSIALVEMVYALLDPPPQLDADMWELALRSRNPLVLHWLRDKGCPLPQRFRIMSFTHAFMLDTLRRLGIAFDVIDVLPTSG